MLRSTEPEMMDFPGQPRALLEQDLRNLRRLNRFLGNHAQIVAAFGRILAQAQPDSTFSLLDVGTGSADVPVRLSRWAQTRQLHMHVTALEYDPVTLAQAALQTRDRKTISLVRGDGAAPPFRPAAFDYVLASQFLHHFSEEKIIALLRGWAAFAREAIVISDLVRHPVAYYGVKALTRLAIRNLMTRVDAPLSVQRAFTITEWRELFRAADVGKVEITQAFPFRMLATLRVGANRAAL